MEKLTRTQVSLLASYSSPFILLFALGMNLALLSFGVTTGFTRLLLLSGSFPLGFLVGRLLYFRRSHIEIAYDEKSFQVSKGHKLTASGNWKSYRFVSIFLDSYGRPDIRLYNSIDGEYVELPISRTSASPQEFRNQIQRILSEPNTLPPSLPVVEAA